MKKPNISPLFVLTLLFILFLSGIYCFRNFDREPVACEFIDIQPTKISFTIENKAPININTASAETLSTLPGIGETLAKRIVSYRRVYGPFETLDALLNVEGIGKGKLEAILNHITTGGN